MDEEFIFFWAFLWLIFCVFFSRITFLTFYTTTLNSSKEFFINSLGFNQLGFLIFLKLKSSLFLHNAFLQNLLIIYIKNAFNFLTDFSSFLNNYSYFILDSYTKNII